MNNSSERYDEPIGESCDPGAIRRYLEQSSDEREKAQIERHLSVCASCQELIQSELGDVWWENAREFLSMDKTDEQLSQSRLFEQRLAPPRETLVSTDESTPFDAEHDGLTRILNMLSLGEVSTSWGRLDEYEIEEAIGCGGMAVVLKGVEPSLNRYVAIKVLAPHLASSETARERFSREAKGTASVTHPNVIAIHRVAEFKRLPYLVMPYVAGGTLRERLLDVGRLDVAETVRIGLDVAAGLTAAHEKGLVHRDIKPANILCEPIGKSSDLSSGAERFVITDFGLARAADDLSITRTGILAGTPHYMSPEQAKGERIDHRSDLFSLGSLFFKLLTGHVPFEAETSYGLLRKIVETDAPDVRSLNEQVPEWMAQLIARLHRRNPDDRFQSASEVASELQRGQTKAEARTDRSVAIPLSEYPDRQTSNVPRDSPTPQKITWKPVVGSLFALAVFFGGLLLAKSMISRRTWPTGVANVQGRIEWNGATQDYKTVVVTRDYPLYQEPIEDETLIVSDDGGVANVFVWLEGEELVDSSTQVPSPFLFQFDRGRIAPHVATLRPNQTLRLRNRDPISHYVSIGGSMNVSLPAGQLFANEFPVNSNPMKIACEVHPWFASYVLIQNHPYVAITDRDGRFVLHDVPKGKWRLRVWHETLGELELPNSKNVREQGDSAWLIVNQPQIEIADVLVGEE